MELGSPSGQDAVIETAPTLPEPPQKSIEWAAPLESIGCSPSASFVYHAKFVIVALNYAEGSFGCVEEHIKGLARAAERLGIPPPIEIESTAYPGNPFKIFKGRCVIRYPGLGEEIDEASASGVELLMAARPSAIVALNQWLIHVETIAKTVALDRPGDVITYPSDSAAKAKPKRSTQPGDAHEKLVAALTKHHDFAEGICLNQEPIGNNELAKAAKVSPSTASEFFKKEFKGYLRYRNLCRDSEVLAQAIKLLRGEVSPHILYGKRPPNEGKRDDE